MGEILDGGTRAGCGGADRGVVVERGAGGGEDRGLWCLALLLLLL